MRQLSKTFMVLILLTGLWACEPDTLKGSSKQPGQVSTQENNALIESQTKSGAVKKSAVPGIAIINAHMMAPAPGQAHGAVYMRLSNNGDMARQLVDISTDVAGTAMVHRTFYENGMMRMRHVHHLELGPKQTLAFEPNGYHIMLMDLESVPEAGGVFILSMVFDQGQSMSVEVKVKRQR